MNLSRRSFIASAIATAANASLAIPDSPPEYPDAQYYVGHFENSMLNFKASCRCYAETHGVIGKRYAVDAVRQFLLPVLESVRDLRAHRENIPPGFPNWTLAHALHDDASLFGELSRLIGQEVVSLAKRISLHAARKMSKTVGHNSGDPQIAYIGKALLDNSVQYSIFISTR